MASEIVANLDRGRLEAMTDDGVEWPTRLRADVRIPIAAVKDADAGSGIGKIVVFVAVVASLLLLGASVASAHEITVVTVVPAFASDSSFDGREVLEGLRLAIDRSPDVGHAPGADGGDHLGGVDVDLIDLDDRSVEAVPLGLKGAVIDGASVVVLVGDLSTVTAATRVLSGEPVLLIAVLAGSDRLEERSERMAVLRFDPEVGQGRAFTALLETSHSRDLSRSAALGYDVGQLLDVVIGRTDGSIPGPAVLNSIESEVEARLVTTSYESVGPASVAIRREPDSEPPHVDADPDQWLGWDNFLWVPVVGVGLVLVLAVERLINRH